MAILCISTVPEGVGLEQVLAVSQMIRADGPPAGGISHAVTVEDGRVKTYDVWESQEALDAFTSDRLVPAIVKAMAGLGMEGPPPPPDIQILEAHDVMGAPA